MSLNSGECFERGIKNTFFIHLDKDFEKLLSTCTTSEKRILYKILDVSLRALKEENRKQIYRKYTQNISISFCE